MTSPAGTLPSEQEGLSCAFQAHLRLLLQLLTRGVQAALLASKRQRKSFDAAMLKVVASGAESNNRTVAHASGVSAVPLQI